MAMVHIVLSIVLHQAKTVDFWKKKREKWHPVTVSLDWHCACLLLFQDAFLSYAKSLAQAKICNVKDG